MGNQGNHLVNDTVKSLTTAVNESKPPMIVTQSTNESKEPREKAVTEEVCKDINPSKLELRGSEGKTQLPVRFQNDYKIQTWP